MSQAGLAAIYCVLIMGASLFGGWLHRLITLTHRRMQFALSFVAGLILGIAVLHLVPHAYSALGNLDRVVQLLMIGFLTMFFLQRMFHFHTHEVPEQLTPLPNPLPSPALPLPPAAGEHVHGPACQHDHAAHAHHHGHDHAHEMPTGSWAWVGVFVGLTLHSVIDGLALGAAIDADWHEGQPFVLAGIGFFLAVFLHKPFDSLSITSLMRMSHWSNAACSLANLLYAGVAPLGVLLYYFGAQQTAASPEWLGGTLAFAAGACLCISTSDLLPELQFHSHDRLQLSASLLLGIGLAWGLVYLEQQGHDHHQHGGQNHVHQAAEPEKSSPHEHDHDRNHPAETHDRK